MKRSLIITLSLAHASCLDAADPRVDLDEQVGQASFAGSSVSVAGGLASVRSAAAGQLALWGQAPAFELLLTPPAASPPDTWRIDLLNITPDAALAVIEGEARVAEVPPAAGQKALPTRRSYEIKPSKAGPLRLRVAPADAASPGVFRFGVLSDVQEAIDGVGDIYKKINEQPGLRFVLGIGDLTQQGTREQLVRFQKELEALSLPYFATLGNHELGDSALPYYELVGRGNSHFVYRGAHFSLLDSASATIAPRASEWLDGWLAEGRGAVHIVGMHIPPIDPVGVRNGAFGSRAEAASLIAKLVDGQVDLSLYGHIHTYQPFSNGGIPAYISGGGGAIPERLDGIGRHFLVVEVSPQRVELVSMVPVDR